MLKDEEKLLRFIKITPIFIVSLLFLLILYIVINSFVVQTQKELQNMRKTSLQTKKNLIKNRVLTLIKHINYERSLAEINLKKELKNRVDEAYEIALNIYNQNREKSKKQIAKMIKDAIRPMRFNDGRGYYFIYSMDLKNVLLPIAPQFEGKDFSNYKDVKGDQVVKNAAKICKKYGATYYTWYWRKPNDKVVTHKKIGYDRYFKPLDWFIGTGEYVDDFNKNLQKKLLNEIQMIRYGTNGYVFTYDYSGTTLTHIKKILIGKNRINLQDKKGHFLVKDVISQAKNGGGFLKYEATINPDTNQPAEKISYIGGVKEWKWAIGTGEYLDDITRMIKTKEEKLKSGFQTTLIKIIIVFLFMAIVLSLSLYIFIKKSEALFQEYKQKIAKEIEKNQEQLLLVEHQNKLASMGEMLGNIAHQWKQPLNALGISAGKLILLQKSGLLESSNLIDTLGRMEKNIEYLSSTIDVFRDFFQPMVANEEFNLKQEINDIVLISKDSLIDRSIELSCRCDEDIRLKGDKKRLEQVLINLLNNAKDAIKEKEISNPKVHIEAKRESNHIVIRVIDNAGGIPKEIEDKVFEPYFTTKFKALGTGVGLYMSKMIIKNSFNGTINFENRNGGAVFIITL